MQSRWLDIISLTLIIVGALNWGLIGFFNYDLVSAIFNGGLQWIARIIFAVVGVAGVYSLVIYGHLRKGTE